MRTTNLQLASTRLLEPLMISPNMVLPGVIISWKIYIFKTTKLPKWASKVFWPTVSPEIPDQKTGWEISTTATIMTTGAWAAYPSPVAPWW
uniref:Uncharacterized protein n=1 Tax=Arundo donax TaxID=35708 RepID=A0A0A9DFJ0_ARUDO